MSSVLEGLAGSVLEGMGGGALRALPYVSSMVHMGLSANEIGRRLVLGNMGIRRSNLLTLVRVTRARYQGALTQKQLAYNEMPLPSQFQGFAKAPATRYVYRVTVNGRNPYTGESLSRPISIGSQNILSNESLDEYVGDAVDAAYGRYKLLMDNYDLTEVLVDERFAPV